MEPILIAAAIVIGVFIIFCMFPSGPSKPRKEKPTTMWNEIKFLKNVKQNLTRDYTIIVDQSGSMSCGAGGFFSGSRWNEARKALSFLAPHVCKADPDGITLYLFNSSYRKYENIRTEAEVNRIFNQNSPGGGTNLTDVLKAAFDAHFSSGGKPETILVITDGQPNDQNSVKKTIIDATRKLSNPEDLSVTFVQIGNDSGATDFLDALDDELESMGAKFDIVDAVTTTEMESLSFSQLIQKSIYD